MGQIIKRWKEIIRINPLQSNLIECSDDNGRSWVLRYYGTDYGNFHYLAESGKKILALTSDGLYLSSDEGRTWNKKS